MAQLVEHILGKDEVISSNLITSSSTRRPFGLRVFVFLAFLFSKCSHIRFDKAGFLWYTELYSKYGQRIRRIV